MSRRTLGSITHPLAAASGKQADVITTRGDIIRGSSSGAAERLAVGTNGQLLGTDGTDSSWGGAGILDTEQASTSGTSIDFTSIPSWVKKITVMFVGVSTNGGDKVLIQIGDSGGIETSGYLGAMSVSGASSITTANYTNGFNVAGSATGSIYHGSITLTLEDAAGFTWVASGSMAQSDTTILYTTASSKSLSATLDRLSITTTGGTEAFDAGAINIMYE